MSNDKSSEKGDSPAKKEEKSDQVKNPPFSNYWRILSFGGRWEHVAIIIAIGCSMASGTALPLMNIVFGNLSGDFTTYFLPNNTTTEHAFKHSVSRGALWIVYLFIAKFVLTYIAIFCFRTTSLRISAALRLAYMESLFAQPVKKLDEVSAGTVADTITTNANTIQASVSDRLSGFFQSIALVIAAFAIAFRYSWALTLVTSSGILFLIITFSITTPGAIKSQVRTDKADEKHATVAAEALGSIRTVFSLGAESKLIEKHTLHVDAAHKAGMDMGPRVAIQLVPTFFTIYCCYALAFWYGIKLYRQGHIHSVSVVIIVFFSVLLVTAVAGMIVQPLMHINKAISASLNFFDMIDSKKVRVSGLKAPAVSAYGDVELQGITFAYPTRPGVQVLKDFSARFEKGKTTALVGPSGSGKSTIVALMERWYELNEPVDPATGDKGGIYDQSRENTTIEQRSPQQQDCVLTGRIVVGDHDVSEFDLRWWRSQIGLVQQEPFLFNDTIENNVAFGLTGSPWEDADQDTKSQLVKEACREAFADEFIENLPLGYSSLVGEGGIKLSGGQRQRIAIARSIVRKPAILILDEATSAIDVKGERIVQEALERVSRNRTTIVIAHRLSTIKKADQIIVLRAGQKIEEGTHEALLSNFDGLYSSLVRAQMIEEDTSTAHDEAIEQSTENVRQPEMDDLKTLEPAISVAHSEPAASDTEKAIPSGGYRRRGFLHIVRVIITEQRSRWVLFVLVVLGAMGAGAAYALQSYLFAHLVEAFQFTGHRLTSAANFWALMFFVLALSVAVCYATLGWCSALTAAHVGQTLRKDYFRNMLKMPITYFDRDDNASGTVMSRLSSDPKQIQELMGLNSSFPLIGVFVIIGCIIVSFYYGWKLTIVALFAGIPVIAAASFVRIRYEVQFEKMNSELFSKSSQFATEAIGAFRTVSSLALEKTIIDKYRKLLDQQISATTRKATYSTLVFALTDSIELCSMALVFWYGGQLLGSREYSPIQFFVIYAATIQSSQMAGTNLSLTPNIAYATAAANRILELRHAAVGSTEPRLQMQRADDKLGAHVEFENVSFRYAGLSTPLFSRLNLSIRAGQFVAFVGPSGCGKTTTISLLERFYSPTSGRILVDDQDISMVETMSYREELSLVAQEPRLFSGTVRQNLAMGIHEASVNETEMIQACKDAEIHDFIASLPDGYETELGQHTQTALSGGQKQRLCLARALLRKPKLLLLDEATSSLDSQSEKLVQGAIERLAGQRSMTVIAVAHRLATIQKADVIFVFGERDVNSQRGSKIVESGSHHELLSRRGAYWSMCQAQALDK